MATAQGYYDNTGKWISTETRQRIIPMTGLIIAAGTPLAAFANGASTTPGMALDNSKGFGIRWNNDAAPAAFYGSVSMPADRKPGTDMTFNIMCWKSGATSGDAVTFAIGCFNNTLAALHDADTDFGGTSGAITGTATAKTVQRASLTLASANLEGFPTVMTFSVKPTAGLLGTDDLTIGLMYLEYTGAVSGM